MHRAGSDSGEDEHEHAAECPRGEGWQLKVKKVDGNCVQGMYKGSGSSLTMMGKQQAHCAYRAVYC